jgi:hypothetical protein
MLPLVRRALGHPAVRDSGSVGWSRPGPPRAGAPIPRMSGTTRSRLLRRCSSRSFCRSSPPQRWECRRRVGGTSKDLGTLAFETSKLYAKCKIQPTPGSSYSVDGPQRQVHRRGQGSRPPGRTHNRHARHMNDFAFRSPQQRAVAGPALPREATVRDSRLELPHHWRPPV